MSSVSRPDNSNISIDSNKVLIAVLWRQQRGLLHTTDDNYKYIAARVPSDTRCRYICSMEAGLHLGPPPIYTPTHKLTTVINILMREFLATAILLRLPGILLSGLPCSRGACPSLQSSSEYQSSPYQSFLLLVRLGRARTASFQLMSTLGLAKTQFFRLLVPSGACEDSITSASGTLRTHDNAVIQSFQRLQPLGLAKTQLQYNSGRPVLRNANFLVSRLKSLIFFRPWSNSSLSTV